MENISKSPGVSVYEYVKEFETYFGDFKLAGGEIPEYTIGKNFAIGLQRADKTWAYFVIAKKFTAKVDGGDNPIKLSQLITETKEAYGILEKGDSKAVGFMASTAQHDSNPKFNFTVNCRDCGGLSHIASGCLSPKRKNADHISWVKNGRDKCSR
jgi:hypothetical protein